MHIISMQSSGADITLSRSGRIRRRISGHIRVKPNFKNESGTPLIPNHNLNPDLNRKQTSLVNF